MEMENNLKYIVYLTINTKNNKIYVGVHGTSTPYEFDGYLGNGILISSPSTYEKAKTTFQYAVKKHGIKAFKRTTLAVFDTKEEALQLEAKIVDKEFVTRRDTYNMTPGGSLPPINEIELYQYDLDGKFIKCWESSVAVSNYFGVASNNIRSAARFKKSSCGYYWTEEYVEKLETSLYHRDRTQHLFKQPKDFNKLTNVYIYNLDGTFYKEFASPKECAEFFGDSKTSMLYRSARLGKIYHNYQVLTEKVERAKNIVNPSGKRKVGRFSLDGELLEEYESIEQAFKIYGMGVKKCVHNMQHKTKGFVFKFI